MGVLWIIMSAVWLTVGEGMDVASWPSGHMVLELPTSNVSPPLFVCPFVWSLWFISPCRFLWLVSPFIEFLSKVWDWGGWGWVSVRSWPDKQTRLRDCNLGCLFELFVGTLRFFSLLDFCPKRDMCGSSYMLVQIISIHVFSFAERMILKSKEKKSKRIQIVTQCEK